MFDHINLHISIKRLVSGSGLRSRTLNSANLAMRERRLPSHRGVLEQECQNVISSPSQALKAGLSSLTQQSSLLKVNTNTQLSEPRY